MYRKIDIRNWKTDEVIFSYTCEDNTIKKTVEEAVKQEVNLAYADLRGANLAGANLSNANLYKSDLSFADLENADLFNANLYGSNLYKSNLYYSDLRYVNLSNTNLYYINLSNANLSYSILNYAKLVEAKLLNTNLSNAALYYAYLESSDLSNVILDNIEGLNDQCPKTGSFIGWKKCHDTYDNGYKSYIVKLEIPVDAKRSSSTGKKCRCSKAKVLEIQNLDGTKADIDTVYSGYDTGLKYKIGEVIEVPDFDERYWIECAPGIHFFMDKNDAINY